MLPRPCPGSRRWSCCSPALQGRSDTRRGGWVWYRGPGPGAWPVILAAALLWTVWRASRALGPRRRLWVMAGLVVVGGTLVAGIGLLALRGALPGWLPATAGDAIRTDLANRLRLLRLGGLLIRDTPFTGIGLGVQEMHLSIYTLLIHVGYLEHLHNTALDMGIEQGLPGAAAYVGMLITALVWGAGRLRAASVVGEAPSDDLDAEPQDSTTAVEDRAASRQATLVAESALAAMVVMVGHGLVDDTVYGSRGLLLLFVPFGLLVASGRLLGSGAPAPRATAGSGFLRALWPAGVVLLSLFAMMLGLARAKARPGQARGGPWLDIWKGRWHANVGVIAQARAELSVYDSQRFSELPMDDVRQQVDLSQAAAHPDL
ncbi:MAG: O-antigen ligase family protein [Anaerolineae bacterium]